VTDLVAGRQARGCALTALKPVRPRTDSRHAQLWRKSAVAKVDRQNGWPAGSA
jgi:hypothetical protein